MSGQATNQDDLASPIEPAASMAGVLMPKFDDITPTHEDVQLAAETHEMSLLEPEQDDITPTHEDVQLAAETHEMSLLEPEQVDEHIHHDDSLSEAS
jgi:hypothetical protein